MREVQSSSEQILGARGNLKPPDEHQTIPSNSEPLQGRRQQTAAKLHKDHAPSPKKPTTHSSSHTTSRAHSFTSEEAQKNKRLTGDLESPSEVPEATSATREPGSNEVQDRVTERHKCSRPSIHPCPRVPRRSNRARQYLSLIPNGRRVRSSKMRSRRRVESSRRTTL